MDAAEALLGEWAIDPADAMQVMVIIDEIGSNIIKAAWPGGGEHHFGLDLHIEEAEGGLHLRLVASDDGVAFDPTTVPPPDVEADLDDREPGGLGLFLVGEMSDSVSYARVAGHNRLTVTKRLQRVTAQPA